MKRMMGVIRRCVAITLLLVPAIQGSSSFPILVDDFTYQLQGFPGNLNQIRDSRFDLAVIDYSGDGGASGEWPQTMIDDVRLNGPCGRKLVVAYFSIGEAEDYRYYWDPAWVDGSGQPIPGVAPGWLGPTNPDWPGNYKVRYWMPGWQAILFGTQSGSSKSYLDRIIDAGFDGVYLDIVDAFEYWGPSEIGGTDENRDAARQMIDLVEAIAEYARVIRARPDFIVIPQNGAVIIEPDVYPDASDPDLEAAQQQARYFSFIDAIGAEDAFFGGDLDENNPYNPDEYMIDLLGRFRTGGVPVLSIEYLTQTASIQAYYSTYAHTEGFVPYATVRALDRMTVNTGFEPDCEASPCTEVEPHIRMPASHYSEGMICWCRTEICVPDGLDLGQDPLFVILEVAGAYFFAPGFTSVDFFSPAWTSGTNTVQILGEFAWPDTSQNAFSARWYAAVTDPGITQVIGQVGMFDFDWH